MVPPVMESGSLFRIGNGPEVKFESMVHDLSASFRLKAQVGVKQRGGQFGGGMIC